MFLIKAYAEPVRGAASGITPTGRVSRAQNPQTRFYLRTETSRMGGNARTRGRPATIRPVRGR